jgi:hypothetical protein
MTVTEIQIKARKLLFKPITKNQRNFEQAINGMCEERLIRTKVYLD